MRHGCTAAPRCWGRRCGLHLMPPCSHPACPHVPCRPPTPKAGTRGCTGGPPKCQRRCTHSLRRLFHHVPLPAIHLPTPGRDAWLYGSPEVLGAEKPPPSAAERQAATEARVQVRLAGVGGWQHVRQYGWGMWVGRTPGGHRGTGAGAAERGRVGGGTHVPTRARAQGGVAGGVGEGQVAMPDKQPLILDGHVIP